MLSTLYRKLARWGSPNAESGIADPITEDMIGTFEEAREEAIEEGNWSYMKFAFREVLGQISRIAGSPGLAIPRGFLLWSIGGAMLGAGIGTVVWLWMPLTYTSTGHVVWREPQVPAQLTAVLEQNSPYEDFEDLQNEVLSRGSMIQTIRTFEVYEDLKARMPVEDIVEIMKRDLHVELEDRSIVVSYSYRDPVVAQYVAGHVLNKIVENYLNTQKREMFQLLEFLSSRRDVTAKSWEDLNSELRSVAPSDPRYPRLTLDRDLTRDAYTDIQKRILAAEEYSMLVDRNQGGTYYLLDSASLPSSPQNPLSKAALQGAGLGSGLGLVVWLLIAGGRLARGYRIAAAQQEV